MDSISLYEPAYLGAGLGAVFVFTFLSIFSGKMDLPGGLVGGLIAMALFLGGGFPMLVILGAFFILGVGATYWGMAEKKEMGLAQENEGKRSVRHALSNGGIAAIYALMAMFTSHNLLFLAMAAGSFASATGDTLSSELGNLYGRKYVNVLTFQPDEQGKDGVVSLEGTLLGAVGSIVIALLFALSYQAWELAPWIALAGILGNILDSLLGATLQRDGFLTNDKVNFWSTWMAACSVLLFTMLF